MKRSDILLVATAIAIGATAITASAAPRGGMERPGFTELDVDSDGTITAEDFEAMRAARFAELDSDGDGNVTREEFAAASASKAQERAGEMFDRLDADGDGVLSRDVLEQRRGGASPRMIERFDTDGDGGLSEEEFASIQERMSEGRDKRGGHGGGQRNR